MINPKSKNVAVGTILWQSKGPLKGRNWYSADNPVYNITQGALADGSNTGAITFEGTNSFTAQGNQGEKQSLDILPDPAAVWTSLASGTGNLSGTFSTEYLFIRIRVSTQGTGYLLQPVIYWN